MQIAKSMQSGGRAIARLFVALGAPGYRANEYRDIALIIPTACAFLLAQKPVVLWLSGTTIDPRTVITSVAMVVAGYAVSMFSPCWNVVVASAWALVAMRWIWAAALGQSLAAAMIGSAGFLISYISSKLGPPHLDWTVTVAGTSRVGRLWVLLRAATTLLAIGTTALVLLFAVEAVLVRAGVLSRLYPTTLVIDSLGATLVLVAAVLIGGSHILRGIRLLTFGALALWIGGLLVVGLVE